jgi:glycerol-3-phosphate dehydrogenase
MTLSGLSGMGDLVLTCTGGLSRNRGEARRSAFARTRPAPHLIEPAVSSVHARRGGMWPSAKRPHTST